MSSSPSTSDSPAVSAVPGMDMAALANITTLTINPDAPSQVHLIKNTIIAVTTLAGISVVARVFCRIKYTRGGLGQDDWTIVISTLLSIALAVVNIYQTYHGFGYHIYDLSPAAGLKEGVRIGWWGQVIYFPLIGIIKMSILLFLLRILQPFRLYIYATMVFVLTSTIATSFVCIFQCMPVRWVWEQIPPQTMTGTCINRTAFYYSSAAINIVSDIVIYVLPMHTMWKLKVTRRQRTGLLCVFGVGAFVVATGLLRLESLKKASVTQDPTWDNVGAVLWSTTELNVGIICASLPAIKPLLSQVFGRFLPDKSPSSSHASFGKLISSRGSQSTGGVSSLAQTEKIEVLAQSRSV